MAATFQCPTGKVVALNVFSLGGVIQRGEKIMDIVPDDDGLTIEAQVAVEEISDVHASGVTSVVFVPSGRDSQGG